MLMRLCLAIVAVLSLSSPSFAYFPRGGGSGAGGGPNPMVTPGMVQPAIDETNSHFFQLVMTNVNTNNISTTYHGSSSDPNYYSRTFCRWNTWNFQLVQGTTQEGLICHHSPTNAELLAGKYDNVDHVDVRCNEGGWVTISSPSTDAYGNEVWPFTVTDAGASDGINKCDAVAVPTTGPDGVMNGPPITALGNRPDEYQSTDLMFIDNGTRGVAGHLLTILPQATILNWKNLPADGGGSISVGWSVTSYRVMPGTFIVADATHNPNFCAIEVGHSGDPSYYCTGSGGQGTYGVSGNAQATYSAVVTGSISDNAGGAGNILDVTAVGLGGLSDSYIYGAFTAAQIDGTFNDAGLNLCIPYTGAVCSGGGGIGKYHTNGAAQHVTSTTIYSPGQATFGDQGSLYYLTNKNGTLKRGRAFLCNGTCNKPGSGTVTGSDSFDGQTPAAAVATTGKAIAQTLFGNAGYLGWYGGTVCVMNSGTPYTWSAQQAIPVAWVGYDEYVSASDPACDVSTDPGFPTLNNDSSTRNFLAQPGRTLFRGVIFNGGIDTQSSGDATFLVADTVKATKALYDTGGIFASAWWCTKVTVYFAPPCNRADRVTNSTIGYTQTDPFHNVHAFWGNAIEGGGGSTMMWVQGTYNSATPGTLSGITLPSELTAAGNTLASIFVGDAAGRDSYNHYPAPWDPGVASCISGADGTIVSATANSVTFGGTPTDNGTCTTGQRVYVWGNNGNHPDFAQWTQEGTGTLSSWQNVIVMNNKFNVTYSSAGQGPFFETTGVDGIYVLGNTFAKSGNAGDPSTADTVVGQNDNVTYAKNIFSGGGGQVHNRYVGSNAETFFKNVCVAGNKLLPVVTAGTNQQSVAAASTPCE